MGQAYGGAELVLALQGTTASGLDNSGAEMAEEMPRLWSVWALCVAVPQIWHRWAEASRG